ncbi:MAG: hypothetical protein ABIS50_05850 [Luteolibacter sp.]|uniref:hypothetical protein n=1 Tax=Luteolibacter sp. TaxID=1962973 RepID=UPI003267B530
MKKRANWLLIPAVALGLGSCDKKKEVSAPEAPAAVAETPKKETPAAAPVAPAAAPKIAAEERAAKLGFVKHLPQDTEVVLAFYNGTKTADRVKKSKLWKLVEAEMGGGGMGGPGGMAVPAEPEEDEDMEAPEAEQDDAAVGAAEEEPEAGAGLGEPAFPGAADGPGNGPAGPDSEMGPAAMFGTEFTLALGKTTGEQTGNLLNFSRRMNYFQMRNLAKAFVAMVKTGDASSIAKSLEERMGSAMMKDILSDPQSGMATVNKAKMPPIYLAFRTSEADRAAAAQEVASTVENLNMMLGPMVEPVKFDVAGHTFEGAKVLGAKIAENMAQGRAEMEANLDAATVDQLIAAVAKKDLVVVSGTVGDYVVLFIGGSTDDLKLASNTSESLVSTEALAFTDAYASKDLAALVYGQKEALDTLVKSAGGIADITNGLRDGLSGADGLGNTRDLEAMFQIVAEREAALRKLATIDAAGTLAFWEEGLKIESFGGSDPGMVDWKASNKLSRLGDSSDVVMFADLTVDAVYDQKSRDYVEALMETGYAMAMKVTEIPMENEQMAQFKGMAKMFDEKFRPDIASLWDTMSNDFGSSLGKESALVVDLKGASPAIPGIPQEVVDKAKVPRISLISPVTDRAKLSGSWTKMNTTLTGTLAKISELTGQEIPMQKPLSSEKNGNITWFFPMPFFTDDFLPSVTVGDKWFVASSSKLQALDLISQADAGGEGRTGVWFSMNFKALQQYAAETYKLVDDNAETLTGNAFPPEQKKHVLDAISTLDDLDKLTVHARREGDVLRSSIHFKTR